MWLLSTRNRPKEAFEAVRSFYEHASPEFRLVVWCDGDDGGYGAITASWPVENIIYTPQRVGLSEQMNHFFDEYPYARFYGWLADDFRAQTDSWDKKLAKAAGDHNIAFGSDGWSNQAWPHHITSAFAIGGELVRATGWFAPPELYQAGIDSVWNRFGREFGLMKHIKGVKVEHLHWKNDKREKDATDNYEEQQSTGIPEFRKYVTSREFRDARDRIKRYLNTRTDLHSRST